MKYAPRYIVYSAVKNYLKTEQVACFNFDLQHTRIHQNDQFLAIVEKYFDVELLRERPYIYQDVGLYYYLKYDAKKDLVKKGYIVKYEKEVILPKSIPFSEIYDSYLLLGIY